MPKPISHYNPHILFSIYVTSKTSATLLSWFMEMYNITLSPTYKSCSFNSSNSLGHFHVNSSIFYVLLLLDEKKNWNSFLWRRKWQQLSHKLFWYLLTHNFWYRKSACMCVFVMNIENIYDIIAVRITHIWFESWTCMMGLCVFFWYTWTYCSCNVWTFMWIVCFTLKCSWLGNVIGF